MRPSHGADAKGFSRRRARRVGLAGVLTGAAFLGWLSIYTVASTESAIVLEFGAPVRVVKTPGLHFKYPHQSVRVFDNRLFVYAPPPTEFLTLEKTPAVASAALAWKIADARRFFETVFDQAGAESRLGDILYAQLGAAIGRNRFDAFVSVDPSAYRAPEIIAELQAACGEIALRDYGIELASLSLIGFDLPKQNRPRLYARMKSERARLSMKYRSEGEEESLKARAAAEEERGQIFSQAFVVAQRSRSEGEGEAARISREAYGEAPDFYRFLQALEASRRALRKETTLVLPADSDLFGLLLDRKWLDRAAQKGAIAHESGAGK